MGPFLFRLRGHWASLCISFAQRTITEAWPRTPVGSSSEPGSPQRTFGRQQVTEASALEVVRLGR